MDAFTFTITSLYSQLFGQRHFGPFCLADIFDICYLLPVTWASWYKFTGRELNRLFNRRPMLSYQFKLPSGIAPAADKWNVPTGKEVSLKESFLKKKMGMGMFCLCLVKSSLCYVCYVQRKKFERVAARFCSSSKRDCYWYLLFHTATKSLSSWYLVHCVHWYIGTLTSTLHTVGLGLVFGCGNWEFAVCVCETSEEM